MLRFQPFCRLVSFPVNCYLVSSLLFIHLLLLIPQQIQPCVSIESPFLSSFSAFLAKLFGLFSDFWFLSFLQWPSCFSFIPFRASLSLPERFLNWPVQYHAVLKSLSVSRLSNPGSTVWQLGTRSVNPLALSRESQRQKSFLTVQVTATYDGLFLVAVIFLFHLMSSRRSLRLLLLLPQALDLCTDVWSCKRTSWVSASPCVEREWSWYRMSDQVRQRCCACVVIET